ncbi:hypothetical protein LPMP_343920 [Leishmania panamensis]|uniref:Uncharacterized protein n=1 Tax=Leishmania panamensis TaxID=5679 RepID=A0A088S171_LEIPA|nr:hypothetical protein LPMP_343920 [Leishmania panamensis]AIO02014.1 hypothetical protein LPMP_343920 [Leishmania panamensis]
MHRCLFPILISSNDLFFLFLSVSYSSSRKPARTMSAPSTSAADITEGTEDDMALRFLNHCLSNAVQVHYLVTSSLQGGDWQTSTLLGAEAQAYMRALLAAYASSSTFRRRLVSGDSLHYLQCLTDEATRADFVRVAAAPSFSFASS